MEVVEEKIDEQLFFNQPAGHWESGESLCEAVTREVIEETGWRFTPTDLVRVYQWSPHTEQDVTFLRFTFNGVLGNFENDSPLDEKIIRTHWLSYEEILTLKSHHRSPQVIRSINDYLAGKRFPLDILS